MNWTQLFNQKKSVLFKKAVEKRALENHIQQLVSFFFEELRTIKIK